MDMTETIREHLDVLQISASPPLVLAFLCVDLALTLVHSVLELRGRLWRYFGAIAGVIIPDTPGFLFFFVGLTATLWGVAFTGIAGWLPFLGAIQWPAISMCALGFLIGARLSDTWFSHVRLARQGYEPNPALASTAFYVVEAIALLVLFAPGLRGHITHAVPGLIFGVLVFFAVIPLLRVFRSLPVARRRKFYRDPWLPGQPPPSPAPTWIT